VLYATLLMQTVTEYIFQWFESKKRQDLHLIKIKAIQSQQFIDFKVLIIIW
jgi:hypothetical protein